MTSTLIRGKYVIRKVTGPNSADVFKDGAVFQRDGEIIEVGKYNDMKARYDTEEVIGSPDYVVMPGLINDHFHVALTPFQLGIPDLPLDSWLVARMGAKDVDPYLDHLYGATRMIRSGTTTVRVIGKGGTSASLETAERTIKAYQDAGMRLSYAPGLSNQNYLIVGEKGDEEDFVSQLPEQLAKRFKAFASKAYLPTEKHIANTQQILIKYTGNSNSRLRVFIAPSNVHRCSDDLLIAFKQLALQYRVEIQIHVQETIYQKLYGLRTWGKTPLQHLNDLGFLDPEVTCAHCVWVTDKDIEILATTGTNVCHLPSSNLRLESGIAPVNQLLEKDIRITLGSDEGGINDDTDMLQEMRLALKIHRVPGMEHKPLTGHQVFQMATANAANNSGFGDSIGSLEAGKRADIVLMKLCNIEKPYLHSDVSIVEAIIQRGRAIDVDTVMIDGEVVFKDGRPVRIDEEMLFRNIEKSLTQPLLPHEIKRKTLSREIGPYVKRFHAGSIVKHTPPHYYYNARS